MAHHSVQIVTPYFLPDEPLIDALRVAAMRGVRVDIVLPEKNNLTVVAWAAMAQLWHVLKWGVPRLPLAATLRPLQDHGGRRHLVDARLGQLGPPQPATQLRVQHRVLRRGPRSRELTDIIQRKLATARLFTPAEWQGQTLFQRLRNGVARLGQPYL